MREVVAGAEKHRAASDDPGVDGDADEKENETFQPRQPLSNKKKKKKKSSSLASNNTLLDLRPFVSPSLSPFD